MLNFSVNTNVGAFVALQNLSQTNRSLEATQTRINTGLKVSSTKDDSATYAIAQSLRADMGGYNAVKTSLDRAQSTLDVAIAAAESISDILVQMKEKATAAADAGLDQDSRNALLADFAKLSDQLATYLNNAEFNGSNILKSGGADLSAIVNPKLVIGDGAGGPSGPADPEEEPTPPADPEEDPTPPAAPGGPGGGGTVQGRFQTISVANLALDTGVLSKFLDTTGSLPKGDLSLTWDDADAAAASVADVDDAIEAMKTVLSELGSAYRQIEAQQTFTTKLTDTVETGIGNLVDADLAKESANLTALQTKQQLGLQALSIANQAPQSILSLFK